MKYFSEKEEKQKRKAMIVSILKYQGNTNYISALCIDEEEKLFVLIARTDIMKIESVCDTQDFLTDKPLLFKTTIDNNVQAIIPFENHNGHIFNLFKIEKDSEYDLINNVLEAII